MNQTQSSVAGLAWEEHQNPGVRAHCRRVAAWALEIASSVGLSEKDKLLLEQVCLLHHVPAPLLSKNSTMRLLQDVAPHACSTVPETSPDRVLGLLDVYRNETRFSRLFEIFETANMFDEQLEMLPFESDSIEDMLRIEPWHANPAVLTVLPKLRKIGPDQVAQLVKKLPVFPDVAAQAIRILQNPKADISDVGNVTRRDQVLAGELIAVANSVAYDGRFPVTTVNDAIGRIGAETAQRILTAAALRPLLNRSGLDGLWEHSLESAVAAEQVATLAGINAEEGFLAGLVHDVGRLLLSQLPQEVRNLRERLIRYGCQPTIVEQLLTGMDHAAAGAEVLKRWNFPETFVTGLLHHHQPERSESPIAALLYLTEFWTASEEDIPSTARLRAAEKTLGIRIDAIRTAEAQPVLALL